MPYEYEYNGYVIESEEELTPAQVIAASQSHGPNTRPSGPSEPSLPPVNRNNLPANVEADPIRANRITTEGIGRFASAAFEPVSALGSLLASGARRTLTNPHEAVTRGIPELLADMFKGAQAGSEQQFTKMFEQYDRGGLEERGPDGSLSPTGRAIAAIVPGVGPMAANIVDRGASGDVAGAMGALAGDVAVGSAIGRGIPRLARGAAASAERQAATASPAVARPALDAMADDLSRVQRTNATLGVTARDLDAGGFNLDNMYDPSGHLIREGVDVTAQSRPGSYTQISELMDTMKRERRGQLGATSAAATADEVRAAVRTLRPALKEARRTNSPIRGDIEDVYRNLNRLTKERQVATKVLDAEGNPVMARRPAPFGPTLTGTDLDKVVRLVGTYIKKFKGNEANEALTAPLMAMRSQLNKLLTERAGVGRANQHLRELGRARRSLKRAILKDNAAGPPKPAVVIPPPEGMSIPSALRTMGDVAGMLPTRTGATLRYGARGGARIVEILNELMGKGATR